MAQPLKNTTINHDQGVPRVELVEAMRDLILPHLTQEGRAALLRAPG